MFYRWKTQLFYFSPDDLSSGGSATPAAAPLQPAPAPSDQGPAYTPPGSTYTGPTIQAPAAPAPVQPAAAPAPQDPILDFARSQGYGDQLNQFKDGKEFVQALLGQQQTYAQQVQQLRDLATYGQQVVPHWRQFQEWRQQQEAAKPKEKPWYHKWHNPPEYDTAYDQFIKLDASGNPLPNTNMDAFYQRQKYDMYLRDQAQKFFKNPYQFIEEPVRHLAQEVAQQIVQQHLGQHTAKNFADDYTKNNPWLFQQDAQGQVLYRQAHTPDGRITHERVLSPLGMRFRDLVQEATSYGIQDPQMQQQYAEKILRAEVTQSKNGAPPAPGAAVGTTAAAAPPAQVAQAQADAAAKAAFIQQQATTGSSFAGRIPPAPPPPSNGPVVPRSFFDIASENAQKQGVNLQL